MIDSFVLLAPILLLAVMALLRFVGCNWALGLEETEPTPTVIVIPNAVTLGPAQTQLFTATVDGVQSSNVAWSADPSGVGILETSGFYRAPPSLSADQLVTITAKAAVGGSGTAAVTLKAPAFTPIRVDCGSLMGYTDVAGQVWSADSNPPPGTMVFSNPATIANTNDPQLYRTLRYGGNFQYQFAVPNSNAIVTLKFAEISFTTAGQRVFNVAINGMPVLSNFDIALEGGPNAAVDKSFVIGVTGGIGITIEFSTGSADVPAINAIEIVSA